MTTPSWIASELVRQEHAALFKQKARNRIEIIRRHLAKSAKAIVLLKNVQDAEIFRNYPPGTIIVIIWSSAEKQYQVTRIHSTPGIPKAIAKFILQENPFFTAGGLVCYLNPNMGPIMRRMHITIPTVVQYRGLFPNVYTNQMSVGKLVECKQWLSSLAYEWIFMVDLIEGRTINRGHIEGLYSYSVGDTLLREIELTAMKYDGPVLGKVTHTLEKTNNFREALLDFCKDLATKKNTGNIFIIGASPVAKQE